MARPRTAGRRTGPLRGVPAALLALSLAGATARAAPTEYLPVGDPLEAELRILDVLGPGPLGARLRLPHLGLRPLQRLELQGEGASPAAPGAARAISLIRLERALARDARPGFEPAGVGGATPRWLEYGGEEGHRLEVSAGLEGAARAEEGHGPGLASGSGIHTRVGLQVERWFAFTHLVTGRIEGARRFADPIVPEHDVIVHTEETYLAWTSRQARWAVQFGRNRWHWGPGAEGSLTLSRTSAPFTGLAYRLRIESLRLDASALSATLDQAAGEQLAAHRLEWQPRDGLRFGATETARYRSDTWQPLYLVGAVPYILVQRLQVQDEPDSLDALRNNVLVAFDAAWRVAEGTRLYGEWLIDDLHARTNDNPNKYAWQVGWEGVGTIGATRLSWGGELTRLTRFVYTSFFGRDYVAQGRPLGFATGPDSRRVSLRAAADFGPDWQLSVRVTRTEKGENDLDEPFLPGSARVEVTDFEGVVERTRDVELGARWWPASGVDLGLRAGWRWTENAAHAPGDDADGGIVALEVRLVR